MSLARVARLHIARGSLIDINLARALGTAFFSGLALRARREHGWDVPVSAEAQISIL